MEPIRGTVVQTGRFGAVVRLEDGRVAGVDAASPGFAALRNACAQTRRPTLEFVIVEERAGRPPVVAVASTALEESFERKIADYLRQTAEWDPRGSASDLRREKVNRYARKRRP
ncbi:MAG TPA: hypothetical protein VKT51_01430 [Candidatus Eremiobacteraceae bacterium]|nr:hypothetical protein [Candidatus Eremiobacteraceae bacterium]